MVARSSGTGIARSGRIRVYRSGPGGVGTLCAGPRHWLHGVCGLGCCASSIGLDERASRLPPSLLAFSGGAISPSGRVATANSNSSLPPNLIFLAARCTGFRRGDRGGRAGTSSAGGSAMIAQSTAHLHASRRRRQQQQQQRQTQNPTHRADDTKNDTSYFPTFAPTREQYEAAIEGDRRSAQNRAQPQQRLQLRLRFFAVFACTTLF